MLKYAIHDLKKDQVYIAISPNTTDLLNDLATGQIKGISAFDSTSADVTYVGKNVLIINSDISHFSIMRISDDPTPHFFYNDGGYEAYLNLSLVSHYFQTGDDTIIVTCGNTISHVCDEDVARFITTFKAYILQS